MLLSPPGGQVNEALLLLRESRPVQGLLYSQVCLHVLSTCASCADPFLLSSSPQESLGYYCYLPFFTVCVGTTLYVWFFLPETKGKSFLEISEKFVKRNFGCQPYDNAWMYPEEIISTRL